MKKEMSLREFCRRYRNGDFLGGDRTTQIEAGWYGWFCNDSDLVSRLDGIWQILKGITSEYLLDNYYVWFENNYSEIEPYFYDDVRFEPLDRDMRDELYFCIALNHTKSKYRFTVVTARNDYEAEAGFDDVGEVCRFINNWENALQDKEFYEQRDSRDAEIKAVCARGIELLREALNILEGT